MWGCIRKKWRSIFPSARGRLISQYPVGGCVTVARVRCRGIALALAMRLAMIVANTGVTYWLYRRESEMRRALRLGFAALFCLCGASASAQDRPKVIYTPIVLTG